MDYEALRAIHVTAVVASYGLFFVRGVWMIRESAILGRRWVRIVPHAIDTVLLASAIALLVVLGQNPFVSGWLAAKLGGLVVYIVLGTIALKRGRTRETRVTAWIAAQGVFFYIVAAALAKRALPFPG